MSSEASLTIIAGEVAVRRVCSSTPVPIDESVVISLEAWQWRGRCQRMEAVGELETVSEHCYINVLHCCCLSDPPDEARKSTYMMQHGNH